MLIRESVAFRIFLLSLLSDAIVCKKSTFPLESIFQIIYQPEMEELSGPPQVQDDEKDYAKMRDEAKVEPFLENITSYSGFLNIDERYDSNLFYWFFESETKPKKDPLLLWLHGGPGHSSLYGLFEESGPYKVVKQDVVRRNTSWTEYYNVLYIDNPLGAGYSYTKDSRGYSRTVQQAAENLYKGLKEFFKIFPAFRKNRFYITGESYCGKYIPALASVIHDENQKTKKRDEKIKLTGLFIGCGFMDPVNQLYYGDYYYEMGILDPKERDSVLDHERKARDYIKQKNFYRADLHLGIIGYKIKRKGYTVDVMDPHFDFSSYHELDKFVQRDDVRARIHVGNAKFQDRRKVTWYFRHDMWTSVNEELSKILNTNRYEVLFYGGQYDTVVPHTQIDRAIESLSWSKKDGLMAARATNWYVNNHLAGFKKSYKKVTKVMVRSSNHIIVRSQPAWLLNLLRSFA